MKKIIFFMVMVSSVLFSTTILKSGDMESNNIKKRAYEHYKIYVEKGKKVSFKLYTKSYKGDADLYVSTKNKKATKRNYTCKSTKYGRRYVDECSVVSSKNGYIYYSVYGKRRTNFSLIQTISEIKNIQTKTYRLSRKEWQYYKQDVKSGDKVTLKITKLRDREVYLYAKIDALPTFWSRDCKKKTKNDICTWTFGKDATIYYGLYGQKGGNISLKSDIKKVEGTKRLYFNDKTEITLGRYETKTFKIKANKDGKVKVTLQSPNHRYHYLYVNGKRIRGAKNRDTIYTVDAKKNKDIVIKVRNRHYKSMETTIEIMNMSNNVNSFLKLPVKGTNWSAEVGGKLHTGRDLNAIDLNLNYNSNGKWSKNLDKGMAVYPIAPGKIIHNKPKPYGYIIIKHTVPLKLKNGQVLKIWYSAYMHMSNMTTKKSVTTNEQIGKISNVSPDKIHEHLHFVIHSNKCKKIGCKKWGEHGDSINIEKDLKDFSTLIPNWVH